MSEESEVEAGLVGGHGIESPVDLLVWPFCAMILSMLTRQLLLIHPVFPYTGILLLLGIALGALSNLFDIGALGESTKQWTDISPELILFLFLPSLIFSDGLNTNAHFFRKQIWSSLLLAGPGVVLGAFLTAVIVVFVIPGVTTSWFHGLTLGAIVSATDPVAILALLKDVGADEKLATLISSESLLNDGSSVVMFKLFLYLSLPGGKVSVGDIFRFLFLEVGAGPAIGAAISVVVLIWLARTSDPIIETILTFTAAYIIYLTADGVVGASGVLAIVTASLILADLGQLNVTGEGRRVAAAFWECVEYLANSLIFFLAGSIIGAQLAQAELSGADIGWSLVLYLFVVAIRAVVIALSFPLLRMNGKVSWKDAVVLWWGGLRGAVGLALALSLDEYGQRGLIDPQVTSTFLLMTSTIATTTLIVNGPTTRLLMQQMGMLRGAIKEDDQLYKACKQHLYNAGKEFFAKLPPSSFDTASFDDLFGYLKGKSVFKRSEARKGFDLRVEKCWQDLHSAKFEELERAQTVIEIRVARNRIILDLGKHYLLAVKSEYSQLRDKERISQQSALTLMSGIDQALDDFQKDLADATLSAQDAFGKFSQWNLLCKTETWAAKEDQKRDDEEPKAQESWLERLGLFIGRITSALVGYSYHSRLDEKIEILDAFKEAHQRTRDSFSDLMGEEEDLEGGSNLSFGGSGKESLGAVFRDLSVAAQALEERADSRMRKFSDATIRSFQNRKVTRLILEHLKEVLEELVRDCTITAKDGVRLAKKLEKLTLATKKKVFR